MGAPERAVDAAGAAKSYGNVEDSIAKQKAFVDAINAANGIQNQSSVFNQLQGVANGTGPNPAQTQLNQSTGQNVANTGALMASSRGASANPGLIARQAAQAGAGIQQNAAGQAATLEAQQRLGALGQLGGVAGQQVGEQIAGQGALTGANQTSYGQILNQITGQNNTAAGLQSNINTGNTAAGINSANNAAGFGGGLMNAAGAEAGLWGGQAQPQGNTSMPFTPGKSPVNTMMPSLADGGQVPAKGPQSMFAQMLAKGGMAKGVPALVSPGERYIPPAQAKQVARGEKKATEVGTVIKGKAKVQGDSTANDTVKKTLSPGGVVVPRTKNMGDDVAEKASAFVHAVLGRKGRGMANG